MACTKPGRYLYDWTVIPNPHCRALWILLPKSRRLLKCRVTRNCTRKRKNFKNSRKAPTVHLDHHTAAATKSVTARPLAGAGYRENYFRGRKAFYKSTKNKLRNAVQPSALTSQRTQTYFIILRIVKPYV